MQAGIAVWYKNVAVCASALRLADRSALEQKSPLQLASPALHTAWMMSQAHSTRDEPGTCLADLPQQGGSGHNVCAGDAGRQVLIRRRHQHLRRPLLFERRHLQKGAIDTAVTLSIPACIRCAARAVGYPCDCTDFMLRKQHVHCRAGGWTCLLLRQVCVVLLILLQRRSMPKTDVQHMKGFALPSLQ